MAFLANGPRDDANECNKMNFKITTKYMEKKGKKKERELIESSKPMNKHMGIFLVISLATKSKDIELKKTSSNSSNILIGKDIQPSVNSILKH